MSGDIKKFEGLLNETVEIFKSFDFVHSVLLFGSKAETFYYFLVATTFKIPLT